MRLAVFLVLVTTAAASPAQEKVLVLVPAVNAAVGPASSHMSNECVLAEIVGNDFFRAVASRAPRAEKIKNPAEAGNGKYLSVTITDIMGWGGGGWSGHKELVLRADIMQGKEVLQTRTVNARSRGGFLGPVKGTCAIFEDLSSTLAQRLAIFAIRWRGAGAEPELRLGPQPEPQAPAAAEVKAPSEQEAK